MTDTRHLPLSLDLAHVTTDDMHAVLALADRVDPGDEGPTALFNLDALDVDELEGLTTIAAAAATDPDQIRALACELEARTNPNAGATTVSDATIIRDEQAQASPATSAA